MFTVEELRERYAQEIAIGYCLFVVATLTTAVRLYTRMRIIRQLGWDDYLIVAAAVLGVGRMGAYHAITKMVQEYLSLNPVGLLEEEMLVSRVGKKMEDILKVAFYLTITYMVEFGVIKLSILQFYHRFLTQRPYRITLFALSIVTILMTIACSLATFFQCTPVKSAWSVTSVGECPVYVQEMHATNAAFNLLTDVVILVLPIRVALGLQMSTRKKFGLILLFALGGVVSMATVFRLVTLVRWHDQDFPSLDWLNMHSLAHIWNQVELNLGAIVANVPALTSLWKAIRRKRKTGAYSGSSGFQGQHYELGSRKGTLSKSAAHSRVRSSSEEQIVSENGDIVQSTKIVVDYERV